MPSLHVIREMLRSDPVRLSAYARCPLRHPGDHAWRIFLHPGADRVDGDPNPKAFFPSQDTGLISRHLEASQAVSPQQMMRLQQELGPSSFATPMSRPWDRRPQHRQPESSERRRVHHCAQAARRAALHSPADHRPSAAAALQGASANVFLQRRRTSMSVPASAAGSFQYTLQTRTSPS